ncbi:MAG TPA: energy transducer TonB [Acidobacteriaceae bacterium]|jgi:protein TonB|nr:energy transducer TonB [Acidobacteriaceae bacterium]
MQRPYAVLLVLAPLFAPSVLRAHQPAASPADQYDQLRSATQLDRKGAQPFHLKIAAQVYDLEGGRAKPATIEAWWAAPDDYRIEINSGPLHEVTATGELESPPKPTRAGYLLSQLYDAAVHPLLQFPSGKEVTEANRTFGKTELACFQPHLLARSIPDAGSATVCTEPGTNTLRIVIHDVQVMVRNPIAGIAPTNSAVSTTISYFGREAVGGTITTLEPFTPGAPGTPALQPNLPKASANPGTAHVSNAVLAGKLIKSVDPDYPEEARLQHIGGTVLLHAIITTQGAIGSVIVFASTSPLLSQAALAAVRQWRYQPYLLNGQPTSVDTTIQVNFNLNP